MKILYIITGLSIGGAETITVNLANEFVKKGNEVAILYLYGSNCYSTKIESSIWVEGLNMKKNLFSFLKVLFKALKFVNHFHPDVVHAQMFHANIFARILRLFSKIPLLICTEHSNNINGKYRMRLYRITDCLSDINTNVSRKATSCFIAQKAFSSHKSLTIYNGVHLEDFKKNSFIRKNIREQYKIAADEFLFLNVGRLTEAKNQDNLITAFSLFCVTNETAKLMIVGDGPLKKRLIDKVHQLKLEDKIIFTGVQTNISDFCNAADCFVLSSTWEGFGIVLVEAMGCELPVITTNAGGCAEVIDNYEYVVPVRQPQLLASKMEQICSMSLTHRLQLGIENRLKAHKFDIHRICVQWIKLYSK